MHWYAEFERWYVGGFLTIFGFFIAWKGAAFSSCSSRFFYLELHDDRLKDRFAHVIDRRKALEGDNAWTWRIAGLTAIVFSVLVLLRLLSPVIGYALVCASLTVVMSRMYLHMRNRSERRAASLAPRSATSSVPALWYAGAVVSAILPITLIGYPSLRIPAVIVAVACAFIVVVAARTAQMAALLAGDDPDIEVYVERRLRWSRVSGLLALAYAASYVFIAMSKPELRDASGWTSLVIPASWILFFGFALSAVARYFLERMRANATSA